MMTQKDDPYTYLFSTLSEVKIAVLIFFITVKYPLQ